MNQSLKYTIKYTKLPPKTLALSVLVLLAITIVFSLERTTQHHCTPVSIIESFQKNQPISEKKSALAALSTIVSTPAPQWSREILETALTDKNPEVVELAIRQVGNLRIANYSLKLIELFQQSDKLYINYADKIRYAIVSTLGKLGSTPAKRFIHDLLQNDDGSDLGQFILMAVKDLNDEGFITDLHEYSFKMRKIASCADDAQKDPLLYSRSVWYMQLASDIENTLLAHKRT